MYIILTLTSIWNVLKVLQSALRYKTQTTMNALLVSTDILLIHIHMACSIFFNLAGQFKMTRQRQGYIYIGFM